MREEEKRIVLTEYLRVVDKAKNAAYERYIRIACSEYLMPVVNPRLSKLRRTKHSHHIPRTSCQELHKFWGLCHRVLRQLDTVLMDTQSRTSGKAMMCQYLDSDVRCFCFN